MLLFYRHGTQSVTISKFIPYIATLLSDQSGTVRDTAFSTLIELYKHVGERLRKDLQKKNLIPPTRLPALLARFDEVKQAGELLPTASTAMERKYCLIFFNFFYADIVIKEMIVAFYSFR